MAGILSVRCASWSEFKRDLYGQLFGRETFEEDRYLFRGVRNDGWHLTSSFDRQFSNLPPARRAAEAARLLELFIQECGASDGAIDACPTEHNALVALAQHFGLPTRGLDWTESPYIAAYFAFADAWRRRPEEDRGHVAIWALDRDHPAWRDPQAVEISTSGRAGNERMIRQRAALTYLHTESTALDDHVRDHAQPALIRFSLPKSDAHVALADLSAMGVTSTRLFPDREGAARAAHIRYAIRSGRSG